MTPPLLLVFSRQRWGAVVQRTQHVMSRLAGRWRVVWVEEPVRSPGPPRMEVRTGALAGLPPALTVLVPHTPLARAGFQEEQTALLGPLLSHWLQGQSAAVDVTWLTTPLAWNLAERWQPGCVVYDRDMALEDSPQSLELLRQQEAALLQQARLVLTGGPSLYEHMRHRHERVFCLPNAVDAAHFAPACLKPESPYAALAQTPHGGPYNARLGFFGAVDERLDLALLAALADAHPDWQLDLVGPLKHPQPATLPRRSNILWRGALPYAALPYLMKPWDIALLPYRVNNAIPMGSPPQALEYLAGDKPVVSTALPDVKALFSDAVNVAESHGAFVQRCEALLQAGPAQRASHAMDRLTLVSVYSWDRTAKSVHRLLGQALKAARMPAQVLQPAPVAPRLAVALSATTPAAANPAAAATQPLRVASGGG